MSLRPIQLKGHQRTVTHVKYNKDGDLLFTGGKSGELNVWFSESGQRLGYYKGSDTPAVLSIDVSADSKEVICGVADGTIRIYDVETGNLINSLPHNKSPVRSVSYSDDSSMFLAVSGTVFGLPGLISIFDRKSPNPVQEIVVSKDCKRFNQAIWGPANQRIYSVGDDGSVFAHDFANPMNMMYAKEHSASAVNISFSEDKTHFITASHDHTAKLWDASNLDLLKTYYTERPVNSAAISPIRNHILLAGGQAAAQVTTTRQDVTQFQLRFFDKIHGEELLSVPGHFGTVNTVDFASDGSFASGAEDGFVRVHNLEDPIFLTLGDDDIYVYEDEFY